MMPSAAALVRRMSDWKRAPRPSAWATAGMIIVPGGASAVRGTGVTGVTLLMVMGRENVVVPCVTGPRPLSGCPPRPWPP